MLRFFKKHAGISVLRKYKKIVFLVKCVRISVWREHKKTLDFIINCARISVLREY